MSTLHTALLASTLLLSLTAQADRWSDNFDSRASGWPDNSETAYLDLGIGMYADGKYQMTPVAERTVGFMPSPKQPKVGDVRLESSFFMYAGLGNGGAGLACRFQDLDNFYAFLVLGSGSWKILKVADGVATTLGQGAVEQVIPGAVDTRMTAECRGTELVLRLDGQVVGRARDERFDSGQVGLFIGGEEIAGAHALFEDFVLETL